MVIEKFIYLNNKKVNFSLKKNTLIQYCYENEIEIPRFCYHDSLSVAGNCRMCLVEIENSLKPVASCAVSILNKSKIYTNSFLVKKAREGVLEFLLANHPLDCPICDQGGECDLQDQTMIFGNDKGRFYEYKRAVSNKNCNPLIKTLMTRCIHCTRCVRFVNEVAGVSSLGVLNRGYKMEIGTYIDRFLNSEVSGNIIDLCPVGALTSKNYSFSTRPWELNKINSIDILDSFGSNICIHTYGSKVMRILPSINDNFNKNWITDKVRFFYDGLSVQRIYSPMIKNYKNNKFYVVSWSKLHIYFNKFFFDKITKKNLKVLSGDLVDAESLISMKLLMNNYGCNNYISSINNEKLNNDFRSSYLFSHHFDLSDLCFFICLDLRNESPLFNLEVREKVLINKLKIFSLGYNLDLNYHINQLSNSTLVLKKIFEGNHWFCNLINKFDYKSFDIIYGYGYTLRKDSYDLLSSLNFFENNISNFLINQKKININYLSINSSQLNSLEINFGYNLNFFNYSQLSSNFFYFLGLNYNNFSIMKKILKNKKNYFIFQGHHGDTFLNDLDIILPGCSFIEKNSLYLNYRGFCQNTQQCLNPLGNSRYDWEIIKFFSILLKVKLNFYNLKEIRFKLLNNSFCYLNNNFFILIDKCFTIKIKDTILRLYQNSIFNSYFLSFISNYYKNDIISKNSVSMNTYQNFFFNNNILKNNIYDKI